MSLFIEHTRTLLIRRQTWSREVELSKSWGRAVMSVLGTVLPAGHRLKWLLHTLLTAACTMLIW